MGYPGTTHQLSGLSASLGILLMLFCVPGFAQSSVWQISKNNTFLYIGGTVHVLQKDDYPLPEEFSRAFNNAGKVIFETDMAEARSPAFSQKMMQQMQYPPGQSLKDILDEQTYTLLSDYFSGKMPMSQIDALKPGMVVIILSAIEFQRLGMVVAGVDDFFWSRALDENKAIGILETIEAQLNFIMDMGKGNESEMIRKTLDDIRQTENIIASLKTAWRAGDEQAMQRLIVQEMMQDYPQVYEDLLVRRNHTWLPHIEAMLENDEIELVLVGALHLIGNEGLLQLLRNKGYQVTHYMNGN